MSQTDKREMLMHLLPISRIKEHNNNKNNNTHEYRFDYSTHWLCDFHSLDFQVRFVLQSMKSIQKHFERTFMQLNSEGIVYLLYSFIHVHILYIFCVYKLAKSSLEFISFLFSLYTTLIVILLNWMCIYCILFYLLICLKVQIKLVTI